MKRLILAVSLVAIAMTASAQIKSAADIQKAIASAEKVAENPKKAANVATWIKIGEAYLNAYENPTSNVVGGDKQQLALVMGNDKPLSSEAVTLGGQPYEKVFADADRDYWMTAKEALEYGMVDEILSKKSK